jgi:hypothetical protein
MERKFNLLRDIYLEGVYMLGKRMVATVAVACMAAVSAGAAVTMEKVEYKGWPNCIKLSNGSIELIATTDVGPRVIRFGYIGGQNLFGEYEAQLGSTGSSEWMIYGGHRLWHAPEIAPRTYSLDNSPVQYSWSNNTLTLTQPVEEDNRVLKSIAITMDNNADSVDVVHTIANLNPWDITLAPWMLTVMNKSGRGIYPQEEYRPHPDYFLPARPVVLWHYTDMSDPRWTWGEKYIQLRQDPKATTKQKFGILNTQGWAAYALKSEVFVKRYAYDPKATYPDYGVNTESYTDKDMLEVETAGPMTNIPADGGEAAATERWYLFKAKVGKSDADIDKVLLPLIAKTKAVK